MKTEGQLDRVSRIERVLAGLEKVAHEGVIFARRQIGVFHLRRSGLGLHAEDESASGERPVKLTQGKSVLTDLKMRASCTAGR